jgi:hypothetical protein
LFESKIDKEVETNPSHLLANRNNFKFEINNIKSVQVNEKPTSHSGCNDYGSIQITLKEGKTLKFLIPLLVSKKSILEAFKTKI